MLHTGPANDLIRAEIVHKVQSPESISPESTKLHSTLVGMISESISPESTKLHRTLGGINSEAISPEIPESIPSVPESRESTVQSPYPVSLSPENPVTRKMIHILWFLEEFV